MATALRNEGTFRPPTTAEELLLLPDEMHGELVDGRFVPMTAPGFEHGVVTMRLGRMLSAHAEDHGLGLVTGAATAFRLRRNPDLVRCPDCAFVAAARVPPPWRACSPDSPRTPNGRRRPPTGRPPPAREHAPGAAG